MPTEVAAMLEDVYRWDNLYAAFRKASKGKRGKQPAATFEFRRNDNSKQSTGFPRRTPRSAA